MPILIRINMRYDERRHHSAADVDQEGFTSHRKWA
jgi:hypothetical protein